jgi:hypothetical protein
MSFSSMNRSIHCNLVQCRKLPLDTHLTVGRKT